jgi:hypothetical protein
MQITILMSKRSQEASGCEKRKTVQSGTIVGPLRWSFEGLVDY